MRVTVCELRNDAAGLEDDWSALVEHVQAEASDLVLLPEMPFHPWLAASREVKAEAWAEAVRAHEAWATRLPELGAATVLWTVPVVEGGRHFNEGSVWTRGEAVRPVHRKYYLPEEDGFWEALWYDRGDGLFTSADTPSVRVGFMICTEMWFQQHAREYGQHGVQLIAAPRATMKPSGDKWLAGGRACAVVSGAFCLSSNFAGSAGEHGEWAGLGWIVEPEEGKVLGTTSRAEPFLTRDIDLAAADLAKTTYPRYVRD